MQIEKDLTSKLEEIGGLCIQLNTLNSYLARDISDLKGNTRSQYFESRVEDMEILRGIIYEKVNDIDKLSEELQKTVENDED